MMQARIIFSVALLLTTALWSMTVKLEDIQKNIVSIAKLQDEHKIQYEAQLEPTPHNNSIAAGYYPKGSKPYKAVHFMYTNKDTYKNTIANAQEVYELLKKEYDSREHLDT